ncbi:MAG: helix-turn-helix transcriptional regulator [Verrucomicrobia bacterium]|nr:helix-turn-helix transcriptional regulator [Verrucomicrobiota bacterium]
MTSQEQRRLKLAVIFACQIRVHPAIHWVLFTQLHSTLQQQNAAKVRNLAMRLKADRLDRGLNQVQYADFLEVSTGAIANWESGRNFPHPGPLKKIAGKLGKTVDELLAPIGDPGELKERAPPYQVIANAPEWSQQILSRLVGLTPERRQAVLLTLHSVMDALAIGHGDDTPGTTASGPVDSSEDEAGGEPPKN